MNHPALSHLGSPGVVASMCPCCSPAGAPASSGPHASSAPAVAPRSPTSKSSTTRPSPRSSNATTPTSPRSTCAPPFTAGSRCARCASTATAKPSPHAHPRRARHRRRRTRTGLARLTRARAHRPRGRRHHRRVHLRAHRPRAPRLRPRRQRTLLARHRHRARPCQSPPRASSHAPASESASASSRSTPPGGSAGTAHRRSPRYRRALSAGALALDQAVAHLRHCRKCQARYRTDAPTLRANFDARVLGVLPAPAFVAVHASLLDQLHASLSRISRLLHREPAPPSGLRERAVEVIAGSGMGAKLAAGVVGAVLLAGGALHAAPPSAHHRAHPVAHHATVVAAPRPRRLPVPPKRPVRRAHKLPSPGQQHTPGGFSYLGVPATHSQPAAPAVTQRGGGPFGP